MSACPIWIPAPEASKLLGLASDRSLRRDLGRGKYNSQRTPTPFGQRLEVDLFSLPREVQAKYFQAHPDLAALKGDAPSEEIEVEMALYSKAPDWSRKQADKYLVVLRSTEGLKGEALKEWLIKWNAEHPDMKTSYPRLMAARKDYQEKGVAALLSEYGKANGISTVKEEWFQCFKSVFLKEGGPSLFSCWLLTMGKFMGEDASLTEENFPSRWAFQRMLDAKVPVDAIYRARNGHSKWYRKYASYVDRDYSQVEVGGCWVSDHAQIDVMVTGPNGKPVIPWVTAWRDFKSGKWLGWYVHWEAPNSDHVFQSFYYAALAYGLPDEILLDNGKDYRSKDFSGGRRTYRREDYSEKARSLVSALRIGVHFAEPYNAQTKPIERDFNKTKEWFSKHMPGYRGGNVVERPECLEDEIKAGKLITLKEFTEIFNKYVTDVLGRMPSNGKVLQGQCPEAYFLNHCKTLRRVSADALMLFTTRVKGDLTVGRNGVWDSELKVMYWAEWMAPLKGTKVFMRRDIKSFQEAWVFNSDTEEFIGKAAFPDAVNALVRNDVDKAKLQERLADKRRELKITKEYAKGLDRPTPAEAISFLATGAAALSGPLPVVKPKKERIDLTAMDRVIAEEKRQEKAGEHSLSDSKRPAPKKSGLFQFAFEREEAEKAAGKKSGT